MIVVRLWGGLGNQMFQYAFGYSEARKRNTELLLDTRFFTDKFIAENSRFTKQELNIMKLPIIKRQQTNRDGELKKINILQNKHTSRVIRLFPKFSVRVDDLLYVKETKLNYLDYIQSMKANDIYYDGYWQTEKYFKEYRNEIVKQFYYSDDVVERYIADHDLHSPETVAIHMRMGDYSAKKKISRQYNYVINPDYYVKAIDHIKKTVSNPRFFVFSNNIEKAKEMLENQEEIVIVNQDRYMTDIQEFAIMSSCSNHIISNSTFSWWAAWIGKQNGVNIAPNVFFGNEDIIPDGWIKEGI